MVNLPQIILALILLLTAIIIKIFPPKNIQYSYGYRTNFSMINLETWQFGNKMSSTILMIGSSIIILEKLSFMFLIPGYDKLSTILFIGLLVLTLLLSIILTEKYLRKTFDKQGKCLKKLS